MYVIRLDDRTWVVDGRLRAAARIALVALAHRRMPTTTIEWDTILLD